MLPLRWGPPVGKCRGGGSGSIWAKLRWCQRTPWFPLKDPGTAVTSGPGQAPSEDRTWFLSSEEDVTSADSSQFASKLSASQCKMKKSELVCLIRENHTYTHTWQEFVKPSYIIEFTVIFRFWVVSVNVSKNQ